MLTALAILAGLFLLAAWVVQEHVVLPSFVELEARQAAADLDRATESLQTEIARVDEFVNDWAGWDDLYRYVHEPNEDFVRSNLTSNVFRRDSFDFLCLVRHDGAVVWRGGRAPDGSATEVDELPGELWPLDHELLAAHDAHESRSGILLTSHGPLLCAARCVTDSTRTAEPAGWILMGRFLDAQRIAELGHRTRLVLTLCPTRGELTPEQQSASERLHAGARTALTELGPNVLVASALFPALGGADGLLLQAHLARPVLTRGREALDAALLTSAAAVLVLALAAVYLLQRGVAGPIEELTRHVVRIGENEDLTQRCALQRDDELGVLAEEFDTMVERLAQSKARVAETARRCGLSEASDAVLQDLRLAVQSLQAQTRSLQQRLSERNLHDLERLSQLLAGHAGALERWLAEDPRGQQLPVFLQALAGALLEEQGALRGELERLQGGLGEMQALVARRATGTGQRAELERVDLAELLDSVVHQSAGAGEEGAHIERALAHVPPLFAERDKLQEVLLHLVRNARRAVQSRPPAQRRIRLELAALGSDHVRIVVEDEGPGLDKQELERIFESKGDADGPRQRPGLRGCARSVRELEGRLWASSDGKDKGARFVLELPLAPSTRSPEDG